MDMCYAEDSKADVDFNVVMTDTGEFIELQGTAEGNTFNNETMNNLVTTAWSGIESLVQLQRSVIEKL